MLEKPKSDKVASILRNPELSRRDRIRKLMKLRDDPRTEQRLASEGGIIYDDGLNSDLRSIEIALDRLGKQLSIEEGKARPRSEGPIGRPTRIFGRSSTFAVAARPKINK